MAAAAPNFEAMAGKWSHSTMKATSSGSSSTASGRRECPFCHVALVRIQSKQPATKGEWYLKCSYNIKDDDSTCPYIRSVKEYMALEIEEQRVQSVKDEAGVCCADLKEELELVKQTLDSVVAEVWKIKMLYVEVMPAVKSKVDNKNMPAVKPKVDNKNMLIVLDSSFVAAVFVGFVGVLLGLLVVAM